MDNVVEGREKEKKVRRSPSSLVKIAASDCSLEKKEEEKFHVAIF